MTRTLATANVQKDMDRAAARSALAAVLAHDPDILALQEWVHARDGILRDLAKRGLKFARPNNGGGPIVWDDRRFGLVHCRGVVLARRELVGHLVGRKSRLPASVANLTILHDDETGDDVAVVNAHLTAEVQSGGRYRRDLAHVLRVRRHKRERRRLCRLVRRQQRMGRVVYVLGDTNYDGLTLPPLVSCWTARDLPSGGTLGNRRVDVIFAATVPKRVRTVETGSDHRAVVATYR